jgi:hypothetical protein
MFEIVIANEAPPAERQGSNLTLLVHQGIPTPEFLSSYEERLVDNFLPI